MICVYADLDALSRAAAELFASQALKAVKERGRFVVLLAGGETPRHTYELLAEEPFRGLVPWEEVHVFWGDERCVSAGDPRSNARMARLALLDRVPIPPEQIHPVAGARPPRQAAEEYEALLRAFFATAPPRFDLIFLGLGDDGHTASLFPGSAALEERERWTAVTQRPGDAIHRVTLTAPLINQAALVAFLVAGGGKAAVLSELLETPPGPDLLPARLIRPVKGELLWFVDREAASLLVQAR
ncbi:MAG: 6-phosphogluconolactonase [Desulfuromonadales bacterium]|nr:MAG: 6-phosphogluconolactonase [Desulfuromonadales bacterium]